VKERGVAKKVQREESTRTMRWRSDLGNYFGGEHCSFTLCLIWHSFRSI